MNPAIESMLAKYKRETTGDHINALREIFQDIALCGLWRGKFFEKTAFYGGTALRVLHKLDRYSEDLDFSLLSPNKSFDIDPYLPHIEKELTAWGFKTRVIKKEKRGNSQIESAFLKAGTLEQLIQIEINPEELKPVVPNSIMKIKIEIDINPPPHFKTETEYLLLPVPFSVRTYSLPSMFAGKMHALLCRQWKKRIKGRDWYDFLWYLGKNIPVDMMHLRERMLQTGHLGSSDSWNIEELKNRYIAKVGEVEFNLAKSDVKRFLSNPASVDIWSSNFFQSMANKIRVV